ncbi:MAG TPA: ACT domain-containing protein [Treponemataceae bacterium]|nr:ACT domain-containing protein [Treponemataceae bacterium]
MNAIITVVGTDQVGIIANVSTFLSAHKINIIDISQTILSGNFVMMMMVDLSKSDLSIQDTKEKLNALGGDLGVSISMMHERVFSAMHRI